MSFSSKCPVLGNFTAEFCYTIKNFNGPTHSMKPFSLKADAARWISLIPLRSSLIKAFLICLVCYSTAANAQNTDTSKNRSLTIAQCINYALQHQPLVRKQPMLSIYRAYCHR
jgi:hypothetical protein